LGHLCQILNRNPNARTCVMLFSLFKTIFLTTTIQNDQSRDVRESGTFENESSMTGISRSITSQSAKHACPSHIDVLLTAAFNVRSNRTENKLTRCCLSCKLGDDIRRSEKVDLFELTR